MSLLETNETRATVVVRYYIIRVVKRSFFFFFSYGHTNKTSVARSRTTIKKTARYTNPNKRGSGRYLYINIIRRGH